MLKCVVPCNSFAVLNCSAWLYTQLNILYFRQWSYFNFYCDKNEKIVSSNGL